jgi:predicted Zn-dependent protease with MMP-like domain
MTAPSRLSPREFDQLVEQALAAVPERFRRYLDNVVIVVEEEATDEDYDETDTPDEDELFGNYPGSPYFERDRSLSALPAQIALFRGPILRSCETRGDAVREIRDTVVHELGHLLGLDDEEMPY